MNLPPQTNHSAKVDLKPTRLTAYILLFSIGWTIVVAASLRWNYSQVHVSIQEIARNIARTHFAKDLLFRKWNSLHGGVYVPRTESTPPNPYIDLDTFPERDITTPSGKALTLMNPAYMIRQVYDLAQKEGKVAAHITSLTPIRKENKADAWETDALKSFQTGTTEKNEIALINGMKFVRLMRPLFTEKSCLQCHAAQGHQVGDIRGGMSISIPIAPLENIYKNQLRQLLFTHIFFWIIGLLTITLSFKTLHRRLLEEKMPQKNWNARKSISALFTNKRRSAINPLT